MCLFHKKPYRTIHASSSIIETSNHNIRFNSKDKYDSLKIIIGYKSGSIEYCLKEKGKDDFISYGALKNGDTDIKLKGNTKFILTIKTHSFRGYKKIRLIKKK